MSLPEVIRAESLCKRFGEVQAVDQVTFSIQEGEIFGFLGPNGAGKTTTIRMLVGLLRPDSGSAMVNGYDVIRDPVRAKGSVGVVPESSNLYGELRKPPEKQYLSLSRPICFLSHFTTYEINLGLNPYPRALYLWRVSMTCEGGRAF